MPRAVCIINVAHEGPGLIGELLLQRGYAVEHVQAWQGERLPDDLGSADLLVVMGGIATLGAELKKLDHFPTPEEGPDFFVDYDETGPYIPEIGESECAT